jgi:hypothetical protein
MNEDLRAENSSLAKTHFENSFNWFDAFKPLRENISLLQKPKSPVFPRPSRTL